MGWLFAYPLVISLTAAAVLMANPNLAARIGGAWYALVNPLIFGVPFWVTLVLVVRGQKRIARSLAASGGRSCTQCLHNLHGLDDTGRCPECGHAYDIHADRQSWERVGAWKPPTLPPAP